jgi:hypothetical protein
MWDGASWYALGSGLGGNPSGVKAVSADSSTGDVYVGGLFILAGGKSSRYLALYHGTP